MSYPNYLIRRPAVFAAVYGLLLLVEYGITRSTAFKQAPHLIAGAVLFDLVAVPVALFYWLIVKPMELPKLALAVAAVTLFRVALIVLPAGSEPFTISWPILIALVEVSLIAIALIRVHTLRLAYRSLRLSYNRETALHGSLAAVFGDRIADIIMSEGQMLRYSLLGWWRLSNAFTPDQQAVTSYRESGQLAIGIAFLFVGLLEGVVIHLLVARWNPTVAFWISALTAYSLLIVIADLVATSKRPSYLTSDTFVLRLGIRWRAILYRNDIATITWLREKPDKEPDLLNATFPVTPNTLITLHEPIWVQGPYGIRKQVRKIALFVDDKNLLQRFIS